MPGRKALASSAILAATSLLDLQRIGAGRLEDAERGRRLAVLREDLAVGLRAELDAADILDADELAAGAGAGLDDDVLELLDLAEAARDVDGVLEVLPGRHRRHADLARRSPAGSALAARRSRPAASRPSAYSLFGSSQTRIEYCPAPNTVTLPTPEHARQLVAQIDGARNWRG